MIDLPKVKFHTYQSLNAPPERRWIAHIWSEDVGVWNIHFSGDLETVVHTKAVAFYESCRAEREKTIRSRQEARQKAAETLKRKKESEE